MEPGDVFSKRNVPLPDPYLYDEIPAKLRTQIIWIWKDTLYKCGTESYQFGNRNFAMEVIRDFVCEEHGKHQLTGSQSDARDDLVAGFEQSKDVRLVLDIVEVS